MKRNLICLLAVLSCVFLFASCGNVDVKGLWVGTEDTFMFSDTEFVSLYNKGTYTVKGNKVELSCLYEANIGGTWNNVTPVTLSMSVKKGVMTYPESGDSFTQTAMPAYTQKPLVLFESDADGRSMEEGWIVFGADYWINSWGKKGSLKQSTTENKKFSWSELTLDFDNGSYIDEDFEALAPADQLLTTLWAIPYKDNMFIIGGDYYVVKEPVADFNWNGTFKSEYDDSIVINTENTTIQFIADQYFNMWDGDFSASIDYYEGAYTLTDAGYIEYAFATLNTKYLWFDEVDTKNIKRSTNVILAIDEDTVCFADEPYVRSAE